jgi:integrase
MNKLKRYRKDWEDTREEVGGAWQGGIRIYIIHNGFGKPLYYTSPTAMFVQMYGLKKIYLHDLRHSAAKLLIEAGAPLKAIQERLRHSKYEVTANLYAHVTHKFNNA